MRKRRKVLTACERQHRAIRRIALTIAAIVLCAAQARGDTITQVAQELTQDSVLPLGPGVAMELATNLWDAQVSASYTAAEPDSLALSIDSVLRAIMLEVFPGGPSEILDAQNAPLPFIQSNIAIDTNAGIGITVDGVPCDAGCTVDFGDVAPGDTGRTSTVVPEPREWIMLLAGLDALLIVGWLKRRRHAKV